jgi:hypothetical protein
MNQIMKPSLFKSVTISNILGLKCLMKYKGKIMYSDSK